MGFGFMKQPATRNTQPVNQQKGASMSPKTSTLVSFGIVTFIFLLLFVVGITDIKPTQVGVEVDKIKGQ
jgi:hypothetical protein